MSGTSVDGLDLAYCRFDKMDDRWAFKILKAETVPYPDTWQDSLLHIAEQDDVSIAVKDHQLGVYIGTVAKQFIDKHRLSARFIASHGHTVFHEPDKHLTLQIGSGKAIAEACGMTTIYDFRSSDVAMGGQGAPLVPIGDRHLFHEYDYCLNIGGIANISYEESGQRIAYDICPANMVLNYLAQQMGFKYDDKGKHAASGTLIKPLIRELQALSFYATTGPKSLGREWVWDNILPLLSKYQAHPTQDLLASMCEHIAMQIAERVQGHAGQRMMISGGGAYNEYLVQCIQKHTPVSIALPDPLIIDFKEAMIFAFLGLLRLEGINNVLGSVTGSGKDHCAGEVIE